MALLVYSSIARPEYHWMRTANIMQDFLEVCMHLLLHCLCQKPEVEVPPTQMPGSLTGTVRVWAC